MKKDNDLRQRAYDCWIALAPLRHRRERYKAFAYGRQWEDTFTAPDGRVMTEEEEMRGSGRSPVTNNLIRQLLKTIVGRYRYLLSCRGDSSDGSDRMGGMLPGHTDCPLMETDARGLEEFLISGTVFQRIDKNGAVRNMSLSRMFFGEFANADGSDCDFIGCLHDFTVGELMRAFSSGSSSRGMEILSVYGNSGNRMAVRCPGEPDGEPDYERCGRAGSFRVVEVWSKEGETALLLHDTLKGDFGRADWNAGAMAGIDRLNTSRKKRGLPEILTTLSCNDVWIQTWLTPDGHVLGRRKLAEGTHPFVMRMYPYIDGEVHSLVEDVVGQQKYVNRLVTLLDDIIAQSGKGVLLFPADQLPDGFSWKDLRRLWSNPGGIVPYRRTSRTVTPEQIHTSGKSEGASEMLRLQLKLFDEVAGVSGILRGQSSGDGADAMRQELENSTVGMLDLLSAYREFTLRRDSILNNLKSIT